MKQLAKIAIVSIALVCSVSAPAKVYALPATDVTVMTWNLYLGADLLPIVTAPPAQIPARVASTFSIVQQTDFPTRAKAIASQMALYRPQLIGLQEADLWRTQTPSGPGPATDVAHDFVSTLQGELASRGLGYTVVAGSTGFDVELPALSSGGSLFDVRLTDRNVILARNDLSTSGITLSNPQAGSFSTKLTVSVAGQPFPIDRGWASIDATTGDGSFRFLTTHLEVWSDAVQLAQAGELLSGPGNTILPLIFAGDFNSAPGASTYNRLLSSGLMDAWAVSGSGDGFTCCQAGNLLNSTSSLNSRIDHILYKGSFSAPGVDIVGEAPGDRIFSGTNLYCGHLTMPGL